MSLSRFIQTHLLLWGRPRLQQRSELPQRSPIVLTAVSDPVGAGFVKSLAHPGGNITGLSFMGEDFTGKSVEVLHTVLPDAKKIAVLISSNPSHQRLYPLAITAAQIIGLSTVRIVASTSADLERAFQDIGKENCDAVLVL